MERLELGYDLSEVVIEYAILRRAITDLAVHTEAPSIRSQELPRLHAAIDQAISTSVVRYTEARERTLRALDRISSAALIHHDVEALLPTTLDAFLETTASVDSVALAPRGGLRRRCRRHQARQPGGAGHARTRERRGPGSQRRLTRSSAPSRSTPTSPFACTRRPSCGPRWSCATASSAC
jgi:hypothetical protein